MFAAILEPCVNENTLTHYDWRLVRHLADGSEVKRCRRLVEFD